MSIELISIIEHTAGAISGISALSVVLTYFLFSDLRKLRYIELVFYVAVNDFFGSVALAVGPVRGGSIACWFQGIVSNFCYVSSILWKTAISYQVSLC